MHNKLLVACIAVCGLIAAYGLNQSASKGEPELAPLPKEASAPKGTAAPKPPPIPPRPLYYAATPDTISSGAPANSTDKLTDGLNALAASGWSLVAIESGTRDRPANYVFQRIR
jgi:hypothetical protein